MLYLSNKIKVSIGIVGIIIISVIVYFISNQQVAPPLFMEEYTTTLQMEHKENVEAENGDVEVEKENEEVQKIAVDVKGEVQNPGVYWLTTENRIQDALKQAGGPTERADVNQVNLARRLYDEMVIYIPAEGEVVEEKLTEILNGKISINQANEVQLTNLPGIGPSKAKAIIDYRTEHGSFRSIEEIMKVNGIGPKLFEKIKEQITIQ